MVFKYYLKNAIVRRTNDTGTEYFINAGGTNQMGLESELFHKLVKYRLKGFIRGLEFRNSFTYYDFIFTDYSVNLNSYSGNNLTGVPEFVDVSSLKLIFPKRFGLFLSYNYTGKIPLNDDNSVYSSSYQLFGAKLSWEYKHENSYSFHVFAGIENILNVSYSLGNDINASGGRYYNPAPPRSYYCGIQMML